jgi:cell division protein FtsZ
MRVSVVATGIDANDISKDTPLPRRSMAEPLATEVQKSEILDKKNENVSDNNLSNQSLAESPSEVIIKGPEETTEDSDKFVPDPVYQSTTDELRTHINVDDSDLFNFIAPRSPDDQISVVEKGYSSSSVEEVSEKTMNQNLNKNLETSHFDKTFVDNKTDQMVETSEQTEIEQTQKTNGRFGINNLISRMTGTSTLAVKEEGLEQDTSETNNTVTDKVEIPAFLRRQAN